MIRLDNIHLDYRLPDGDVRGALANVDLHIKEAEFVCVIGPSGCGKSSLLNLIAGFIQPTAGSVSFNGTPVSGPGPDRGVVFQEPTLFPWLTVRRNVEFGLRQTGHPPERIDSLVAEALATVGMQGHEDAFPYALSGGMRQRVAIARVLVLEPKALLMDEPFSALDANTRERLQDELLRIWEHHRRTVFYVTHSVEEAAYLADRVLVMGGASQSIEHDIEVPISRPRDRLSTEVRALTLELREKLDQLPLCIDKKRKKKS